MGGFAWVTLATNDSYSLGALVLAHSLRQVGTRHQIAVLVTPGVTDAMREKLLSVFDVVQEVNIMDSKDEANLRLLQRPELGITFTKLHCWRLTQFEKCVFLDADILVVGNADELFDREELSAAPDVGWPDCFNSGVFVYRPSNETYEKLVCFALEKGSFDGGDQGLLNLYFSDWAHKDISKHLPFIYNMCSTAGYSYLPAFKQFGENVKIVHFIGNTKPWLQYFDTEARKVKPAGDLQHLQGVLQLWWDMFFAAIQPNLTAEMGGLAGAFSHLKLGEPRSPGQIAYEDLIRRQGWEAGNIDYLGRDSFDNIWKKICLTIEAAPAEKPKGYQTEATALQPQETSPAVDPPAPTQTQQEIKPTPVTPTPTPESPQTPATTTTPSDPPHTPEEPQVQTQSQPELEETKPAAEDPKSSEPLQAITTTPKLAIAAPPQVQKPPIALPGPDELPAEPPKPEPVEPIKEIPLECPKPEPPKEIPVQPKDEPQKVEPAEVAKEAPAEAVKEAATEAVKEASTEAVKEAPAEAVKEVQEQLVCPRVQEKPLEKPVEATVEKPAPPQTKEKSPEKPEAPKSTEKAPEKPATPQAVQETPEKPAAVQVVETTPVEKAPEKPAVVDTTPTPPEAEAAPTAPQEEKPKAPEGKVPDTPPPAQASGPTPPPRKASGGGKKGGKKK